MQSEIRDSRFEMKRVITGAAMLSMLVLAGCRQDMHDQPKFIPQRGTTFYADGRSVRPQVTGTVARSQAGDDSYFATGMVAGKEGDGLPIPLNIDTIDRGQERYNIYCSACHSRVGNGEGVIVQRGYRPAGNFHTDRLRNAPLGHFFAVMTNGYGAMPDYAAQLTPEDRWAVAAYIRALQLSQNAKAADVPAGKHVEDLHEIAHEQGKDGMDQPWTLPGTAIYGTPNGQDNGIPGQGTTTAPNAAKSHESAVAGPAAPSTGAAATPVTPAPGVPRGK